MFNGIRSVLNGLNQFKYVKNINRLEKKPSLPDNSKNLVVNNDPKSLKKIENLARNVKKKNLIIFVLNYASIRLKRFFIITLPTILSVISIGTFVMPSKYVKNKKLDKYKVEKTYIDSDKGYVCEETEGYSAWLPKNPVDKDKTIILDSITSDLNFRITDGIESVASILYIESDGKLRVASVNSGAYIDLTKYDSESFQELESKYGNLFDEIIALLNESSYASSDEKKLLNKLNESEKKQCIAEIVKYTKISDNEKIAVKVSRWPLRIFMVMVTAVYIYAEFKVLSDVFDINDDATLDLKNGELYEIDKHSNVGVFLGPILYREYYLAAERERIRMLYEEASKNFYEPDKLLTKYEQKVLRKTQKTD